MARTLTGVVSSDKRDKTITVMIQETRPISKTKTWTLVKIVEKSRGKVELKEGVTEVESDKKEEK